jgi:hypothetical protein
MEVVSPLTFNEAPSTGNKRRYNRSPIHDNVSATDALMSDDVTMMDESCGFQAAKRRRKNEHSSEGGNAIVGGGWMSPFAMAAGGSGFGNNTKRSRSRSPPHSPLNSKLTALQNTISQQAAELSQLKSEHASALASHSELTAHNSQLANENKILKKAVAIQQERQTHLVHEIEEAKRVNGEANERIRRLEQMNLTLRYQLQAQQGAVGNDFMGFSPRPPDVY